MKLIQIHRERQIENVETGFSNFFETLRDSIKDWGYFVDWEKVFRGKNMFRDELAIWDQILGSENFDSDCLALLEKHPEIVRALPFLIVREGKSPSKYSVLEQALLESQNAKKFDFSKPANSFEARADALEFIRKSGLVRVFESSGVSRLEDYLLGVEAGLDSNGRKNRSGKLMESLVGNYLETFCQSKNLKFISQATIGKIKSEFGFDVAVDKSSRRFDFAVTDGRSLVLIEVNFYGGDGSKLKATAGEYVGLGHLVSSESVHFVWVTDGHGWHSTKQPLREAFEKLDYVWNLNWLTSGALAEFF